MQTEEAVRHARTLLEDHAQRTGVVGDAPPRRYLWTDAFAVCTWLEVHRATGEEEPLERALALVDQVHRVLGRHREDDSREGWISGLDEEEGAHHPTRAGLRIGKPMPERSAGEPIDERVEWDRDGQYYHYSTKWMHALGRVAAVRPESDALQHAVELAVGAHEGFAAEGRDGRRRLVWKLSIDRERPLVPATGHHDPLDGLATLRSLRAQALAADAPALAAGLEGPIEDLRGMCRGVDWRTVDPLGIGGLLFDALRFGRLLREETAEDALFLAVLQDAAQGLDAFARGDALHQPAPTRLAFRELGLSIGMHAVPRLARCFDRGLRGDLPSEEVERRLNELAAQAPLAETIEAAWLDPASRESATWRDHLDINAVMLAASLAPAGFLGE